MTEHQTEAFLYFAYGSNMLTRGLTARTPSAKSEGTACVTGHRLEFHKVGSDGSGKANINATGIVSDRVYGVLFRIAVNEEVKLDEAEGLNKGYRKDSIEVITPTGTAKAKAFIATETNCACVPYHWYKALVLAGAVEHGLPSAYIEWLRTFASKTDADQSRRSHNEALLFGN